MAVVGRTGGQFRLSMLGKDLTTGDVDLYYIQITTGEPITLSIDPLSSGNYDMIPVRGRDGSIMGQVQGDEQDPNGEVTFTFFEDFDFLGKKHVYGNSKDRLKNLLNGEAFYNKGNVIVPIGTNGTDKTTTARAKFSEVGKAWKMLFYNEGEFIRQNGTANGVDGRVQFRRNPYKQSFDMFNKTFCFELMTTSGQGQVNRMIPILAKKTLEFAEGDTNQYTCTADRGCDVWEKDDFFAEVTPISHTDYEGNLKNFNEIPVDYIVIHEGTEPSESVVENQLLVSIDDSGVPTIKKYSSSSWQEETNLKKLIKAGTRFKSRQLEKSGSQTVKSNIFAVVGEDGKTCVDFSSNNSKRYYCLVKGFDAKMSLDYEDYITE